MKIVIDIPGKMYNMINAGCYDYGDMNVIIQNGTPLPDINVGDMDCIKGSSTGSSTDLTTRRRMTNEEAIQYIRSIINEISDQKTEIPVCYVTDIFKEPLEMAIEALEERTRTHASDSSEHETHEERTEGDCISRKAAIEYFMINTNWHDEDGDEINDADEKRKLLEDYFSGVPSVNPAKWIPCKERMPKDYEEVLVYSRIDDGIYVMYHIARDEWWESNDGEGFCFDDHYIAAWQPLPEPYKEKKE